MAIVLVLDKDVVPLLGSGFQLVDDLLNANRIVLELEEYR